MVLGRFGWQFDGFLMIFIDFPSFSIYLMKNAQKRVKIDFYGPKTASNAVFMSNMYAKREKTILLSKKTVKTP